MVSELSITRGTVTSVGGWVGGGGASQRTIHKNSPKIAVLEPKCILLVTHPFHIYPSRTISLTMAKTTNSITHRV